MDWRMHSYRGWMMWACAVALMACGHVALRVSAAPAGDPPPPRHDGDRGPRSPDGEGPRRPPGPATFQRTIEQLDLTAEQTQKVQAIVQTFRDKERQAREKMLAAMKQTLTPQQYEKLESAMRRPPGPPPRNNQGAPASQAIAPAAPEAPGEKVSDGQVPVTFTGGYETDPRDHGRPVVLIAAALKVPFEVFRKAFSGVTPARGAAPEPEQVRKNKQALMSVLEPYGITNDRLDEVSNFYRYNGAKGQMWRNTPASATATIKNGKVVAITLTNPGFGYSSTPQVSIPGHPDVHPEVVLTYGPEFKTNGSIKEIKLAPEKP